MKTYQLHITGKVQGVWYRASAKDKAIALGLTGKVWNEPNGDVSAIVQGHIHKIHEFIDWCKKGPPLAQVESVVSEEMPAHIEVYKSFDIER